MNRLSDVLREVAQSYQRGLRDALRPRLAFSSLLVAVVAAALLLVVFILWHAPIRQWSGYWVAWGLAWLGTTPGSMWVAALTWLLIISFYLLGVMLLMQIMLELWLMPRIQSVCLRRHPALLERRHNASIRQGLLDGVRTFLTWAVGGLVCLLVPVIGGLLLLALSSYLAVRSLVNDSLDGLASDAQIRTLIRTSRPEMLVLGLLIALTAVVPLLGLLVPVLAGASTCHLMMGRLERLTPTASVADSRG